MSVAEDFMRQLARALAPEIASELRRMAANDAPPEPGLLTRSQCARALNISVPTLDRAIKEGCPKVTIGRNVRFDVAAVREWMSRRGNRPLRQQKVNVPGAILRAANLKRA